MLFNRNHTNCTSGFCSQFLVLYFLFLFSSLVVVVYRHPLLFGSSYKKLWTMWSKVIQWYKQLLNHILIRFHGTWLMHTHIFFFLTFAHITQQQLLCYENRKQLLIFAPYTITSLSLYCSLLVWYLFTMYIRYEYLFFVKHLLLCFLYFFCSNSSSSNGNTISFQIFAVTLFTRHFSAVESS